MICVIYITRNKHINLYFIFLGELHLIFNNSLQKQPLEVFCKNGVLKNFVNFHRKPPLLESLFNKVACPQA